MNASRRATQIRNQATHRLAKIKELNEAMASVRHELVLLEVEYEEITGEFLLDRTRSALNLRTGE